MESNVILLIIGIVLIYLMTRRWFWLFVSGIGALASLFAMLASIIHFQILGALGFLFLIMVCGLVASIADE